MWAYNYERMTRLVRRKRKRSNYSLKLKTLPEHGQIVLSLPSSKKLPCKEGERETSTSLVLLPPEAVLLNLAHELGNVRIWRKIKSDESTCAKFCRGQK